MHRLVAFGLSVLLFSVFPDTASAQDVPLREAAREQLRPDVRDRVVPTDTLIDVRTRRVPGGRIDVDDGIWRARYRIDDGVPSGLSASAGAVEHVQRSAQAYGVAEGGQNLAVADVIDGRYASHVRLRQMLSGVPVYRGQMKVSLDGQGQPSMVVNGYFSHLDAVADFDPTPGVSASRAARIVQTASTRGLKTSEPELIVYPSKPPRLAWRMTAVHAELPVEYEALVDAHSGEIIRLLDITLHAHGRVSLSALDDAQSSQGSADSVPTQSTTSAPQPTAQLQRVDGTGWVFDPDPVTSAGVEYGGAFVDNNDADDPLLTDQLFTVPLRDISQGTDGLYRLEGPYVHIDGSSNSYIPPAEASPDAFTYTRANDAFEAVMAYYHVDKSQRYIQTLDVGFPIKEVPVRVNPQGRSDDESNFSSSENLIRLGTGGVDDAEDADVIWHEYAHALLFDTAPDVPLGNNEGGAFHEGWSDYWTASYSRYLSEEDDQIPTHDWRHLFNWDGNNGCWLGRTLDHPGRYPDDMYYQTEGCVGDKYQEGLLWATTLMDIYPSVGRTVLDRLNLASHAYLGTPFAFPDAAEALIQADFDLYAGAHTNVLVHHLDERGYIDEENYGPVLAHDPLPSTEFVSGTVRIEATAAATSAAVDSVLVFYGTDGTATTRLVLEPEGGNLYAGDLPLPGEPASMSYYVQAVDIVGRRRSLPVAAPVETFAFDVGPDTEAPTIEHDPPQQISVIGWPVDVYALVHDNFSVDSAWVEYAIEPPGGGTPDEGSFGLAHNGDVYVGRFPATSISIEEGGAVSYRIVARDGAATPNVQVLPQSGSFTVPFVEEGILRTYDFEGISQGETVTGVWMRAGPEFGLQVAHSGSTVWATNPSSSYPDASQHSTLSLTPMDLSEIGEAYLVFWHWYDFEHDGVTEPGAYHPDAELWDGGNVKIISGGDTSVVIPLGGYNGRINEGYGNPLGGEDGFGGYSFGWRRAVIPLPQEDDVRVRFDFGSDQGNQQQAKYFAGWYIDDVTITTILPEDTTPPVALELPQPLDVRTTMGEDPPLVTVEAVDDTGIEAVLSAFTIYQSDHVIVDTTRLAMAESDLSVFAGPVVPFGTFSPGDRIEYTIVLRDFDGNEVGYGDPFAIEYRSVQEAQALRSAVSTGSWAPRGSGWTAAVATDDPVSSLVLEPFTLPANAESSELLLDHSYTFGESIGSNVKVSTDDGRSWTVLEPVDGYPAVLSGSHSMSGEAVFADAASPTVSVFDLSAYGGSEIRVRLDLAQPRPLEAGEEWTISAATYRSLSSDPEVETERELKLHANFPDPVVDQTTITYTVPDQMVVRLSVYDMLGRRVAVIQHANHEPGTYTVAYEPADLASGVYMLYMETPTGTRTEQMVIAR